ncbi:MAG: acetate/propionate family kinase, partial [Bacteroidetes bacterium]|nr:acetate/propionate family kinase [Bacteroidota bacterium]
MNILVINCGSSSVKAEIVDTLSQVRLLSMRLTRIGEPKPELAFQEEEPVSFSANDYPSALTYALDQLFEKSTGIELGGIGHRVVHGGDRFSEPVVIDSEVETAIDKLSDLAPLHNPANLAGIRIAQNRWPDLPHVAVFDTAFHQSMPMRSQVYGLPQELADKHGLRRYGFHGSSHSYVARKSAEHLGLNQNDLRIISCHLGNGASVCAVEYGRSVETSMGLTPLEGLVMGSRSGDLDPGILIRLMKAENWT